uniref:Uncharacterized protein n=1 Tax=Mycena chlorophos TaxID=658473 RepID=A0ABQ0KWW9_MYCCL|nr:predicted protein [Mycena chlorophos]
MALAGLVCGNLTCAALFPTALECNGLAVYKTRYTGAQPGGKTGDARIRFINRWSSQEAVMAMLQRSWLLLGAGFVAGLAVSAAHYALAGAAPPAYEPSKHVLSVSIDEVKQSFVTGVAFSGSYTQSVTLSNGTVHTIRLDTVQRNGVPLVHLNMDGRQTYMGPNSVASVGSLEVTIQDRQLALAQMQLMSQRRQLPTQ